MCHMQSGVYYMEHMRLGYLFTPASRARLKSIWWLQGPLVVASALRGIHLSCLEKIFSQMTAQRSDDEGACSTA